MPLLTPPTLATRQIVVDSDSNALLLFPATSRGHVVLIVNRGGRRGRIGSDSGIGASDNVGFVLRPGEGILLATTAEIWATNTTYHVLELA